MERVDMPQNEQSKCLIFKKKKSYFINEIIPVLFNKTNEILHIFLLYTYIYCRRFFVFYIFILFQV